MISICCVGLASFDVVSDKCVYVYCVKSFADIECYSDCSHRGRHLVDPLATVLFNVCSAVTVECCVLYPCFVPVLRGCVWYVCCYVRKKALLQFAITERKDMGIYEVPLSISLLGFRMGTMLANFHVCPIMLLVRAVFNMIVSNASPRRPMCFRCLMFSLSGPCELLFLLCFITSWTWVVVSVMLCHCILCVSLLMDLFVLCVACLTVFVNCLSVFDSVCELFGETIHNMFGCGCYFVVECYGSV